MWEKLEAIEAKYRHVEKELADPDISSDFERMAQLGREYKELGEIVGPYLEGLKLKQQLETTRAELAEAKDEELREMLKADIIELEPRYLKAEAELTDLVTPKDPLDAKDCILEVRAGA